MLSHESKPAAPAQASSKTQAPDASAPAQHGSGVTSARVTPVSGAAASDALSRTLERSVLQRKVQFKPPPHALDAAFVFEQIKRRKEDILPAKHASLLEGLDEQQVLTGLKRIDASAVDYGKFDLTRDQDLGALLHELLKQKGDETESAAVSKKDEDLQAYLGKSDHPVWTYDLALLGTGAGVAYYITSHKHEIDYKQTVVIGQRQPWDGTRGPGVINHPEHMITAIREHVGYGTEALLDRADFSRIVKTVIDDSVCHQRDAKIKTVQKTTMNDVSFYRIDVSDYAGQDATFYAKRVVAGLGIGGQLAPTDRGWKHPEDKPGVAEPEGDRAMNMDTFQQRYAGRPQPSTPQPRTTVVITGPNAGIDAVKTAIECGFTIIWVTGSGRPGFLPGTDNELVEDEYDKCMKLKPGTSAIAEVIQDYSYLAYPNPGKGKPLVVDVGKDSQSFRYADLFVWAIGPNVAQVRSIFPSIGTFQPTYDENRQFSGEEALANVIGLQAPPGASATDGTSLQIIGGAALRLGGDVGYDYLSRPQKTVADTALAELRRIHALFKRHTTRQQRAEHAEAAMLRLILKAQEYMGEMPGVLEAVKSACNASREPPKSARPAPVVEPFKPGDDVALVLAPDLADLLTRLERDGLKMDPRLTSLPLRFASAVRVIERYGRMVAAHSDEVRKYLGVIATGKRAPDPRKAGSQMGNVIESLPLNVLMNDQLTPTRSQVEATAAFVPDYVQDEVNYATDSATTLSIHIAVRYPKLPDREVDLWVDRILRWRRPTEKEQQEYTMLRGPIPNPNKKARENAQSFAAWFDKRLREENAKH